MPTGMYCAPCATWLWLAAVAGVPLVATPPAVQPPAAEQTCAGIAFGSTLSRPWYPNDPTYDARNAVVELSCRSTEKFHS